MLRETECSPLDLLTFLGFEDPGRFGVVTIVVPQAEGLPICMVVGGGDNDNMRVAHLTHRQRMVFMQWFAATATGEL